MPSLPIPPDGIARLQYFGSYKDTTWMVGYWLKIEGAFGSGERADLATDLYAAFQTTLLTGISSSVNLTECRLTSFEAGGEFTAESFASHAGGTGPNALPANCCYVISWSIPEHYRGGHPRTYLPGVELQATGSERLIPNAIQATLTTQAADFITAVNALTTPGITDVKLGTLARIRGGVALDPAQFEGFTAGVCRGRIGSQRRRLGAAA